LPIEVATRKIETSSKPDDAGITVDIFNKNSLDSDTEVADLDECNSRQELAHQAIIQHLPLSPLSLAPNTRGNDQNTTTCEVYQIFSN